MNITECIINRRSTRVFQDTQIQEHEILKLIEAAIHAPSACNRQGWKFIWVTEHEVKKEIELDRYSIIEKAPSGILVLYRNDLTYNSFLYKDHYQSAAAAIQNLLLTATSLGIGACWVCALASSKKIRKKLHIPSNFDVIAYIALGYPKKDESTLSVNHYENIKEYRKHKRSFLTEQVLSKNEFLKVKGDCTELKKKPYCKILNYLHNINPHLGLIPINKFLKRKG